MRCAQNLTARGWRCSTRPHPCKSASGVLYVDVVAREPNWMSGPQVCTCLVQLHALRVCGVCFWCTRSAQVHVRVAPKASGFGHLEPCCVGRGPPGTGAAACPGQARVRQHRVHGAVLSWSVLWCGHSMSCQQPGHGAQGLCTEDVLGQVAEGALRSSSHNTRPPSHVPPSCGALHTRAAHMGRARLCSSRVLILNALEEAPEALEPCCLLLHAPPDCALCVMCLHSTHCRPGYPSPPACARSGRDLTRAARKAALDAGLGHDHLLHSHRRPHHHHHHHSSSHLGRHNNHHHIGRHHHSGCVCVTGV